jgi:hypothetical protein
MGQKHNRRRNRRPRSRPRTSKNARPQPSFPVTAAGRSNAGHATFPPMMSAPHNPMPVLPAPHWHNGYAAWDSRERRPLPATMNLELERCRLFGGEPGDDVALCYRMLEYFGRLDYIDT